LASFRILTLRFGKQLSSRLVANIYSFSRKISRGPVSAETLLLVLYV
jgi:hypothetical protein